MKILVSVLMASVMISSSTFAQAGALAWKVPADCVGGLPNVEIKKPIEGKLTITNKEIMFESRKGDISIPASRITKITGGQYAKRRVKSAVISSILLTPVFLFVLIGKKKRDIILIEYADLHGSDSETRALILRYKPKNGRALSIERALESATGVKVEKEDPEEEKKK